MTFADEADYRDSAYYIMEQTLKMGDPVTAMHGVVCFLVRDNYRLRRDIEKQQEKNLAIAQVLEELLARFESASAASAKKKWTWQK